MESVLANIKAAAMATANLSGEETICFFKMGLEVCGLNWGGARIRARRGEGRAGKTQPDGYEVDSVGTTNPGAFASPDVVITSMQKAGYIDTLPVRKNIRFNDESLTCRYNGRY
jgi:hypothetical protein